MESCNISYRNLRNPKKQKLPRSQTSHLLQNPHFQPQKPKQTTLKQFSIMTQNVTRYQHMLKQPHIKQNYIDWVVKLRSPIIIDTKKYQDVGSEAPSAYNKNTLSRENFLKTKQINHLEKTFNSADYYELLSRKCLNRHIHSNTLSYMTSLRQRSPNSPNLPEFNPKFSTIPYKDKHQFPTFLLKSAIKRTTNITNKQKQSALDGSHNYPPYSQKNIKQKNYAIISAFDQGKNKVAMPTLVWEMGLRN